MSNSANLWTIATRLLCPWDPPGKKTGVSCYALLQARKLESVAMLSRGSLQPKDQKSPMSPAWQTGSLPLAPPGSPSS